MAASWLLTKIWEFSPLALVTLGTGCLPSAFFWLLVLQLLRHVVSINSVVLVWCLLVLRVMFTSCSMPAWDIYHASEESRFLLIDAGLAMPFISSIGQLCLWVVWHEWSSGAQFCFNTYCHWSTPVVHHCNGHGHFLHSQEGVTHTGGPVAMVAYGLSTLLLICQLKTEFPELQHVWYADDSAAGPWLYISHHFHYLQQLGSTYGYFPEATKSVLVVSPFHQLAAQPFFFHLGAKVCTGHQYFGDFNTFHNLAPTESSTVTSHNILQAKRFNQCMAW